MYWGIVNIDIDEEYILGSTVAIGYTTKGAYSLRDIERLTPGQTEFLLRECKALNEKVHDGKEG